MSNEIIFKKAKRLWGLSSQVLMLVEELNELAVASLHLLRNSKDKTVSLENFAEEIADVELMIAAMKYYFRNTTKIAEYRMKKEARLRKRLWCEG